MHDIIEQMKAGLDELEYQIPAKAWERFQARELKANVISKKYRGFNLLKAAAVLLLFSITAITLQQDDLTRTYIINYQKTENVKLKEKRNIEQNETKRDHTSPLNRPLQANRADPVHNVMFINVPKTNTIQYSMDTLGIGPPGDIPDKSKTGINRWILAEIMSGAGEELRFRFGTGLKIDQMNWYCYEKSNGRQSIMIKSSLEEHPSKYTSYNAYQSFQAKFPQDFSGKLNHPRHKGPGNNVEDGSRSARSPGDEVGSAGIDPTGPESPAMHGGASWSTNQKDAGPQKKTETDKTDNDGSSNRLSETSNLQNLEYYNLSIGFKQKLKKDHTLKIEPFLRIPVTGLQNREQFNHSQYGLKIGLSF